MPRILAGELTCDLPGHAYLHSPDEGGVDHEGDEGCPGLWQVNSPAACQDMHGPDEGGVDPVQDESEGVPDCGG